MIFVRSRLEVADNTGAKTVMCFQVLGRKNKKYALLGDIIVGSVKELASGNTQLKKGEVVKAVVVRTCHPIKRANGMVVKFDKNACVLIDKEGNPRGTRVFGVVARELREKYSKILSLAPEVI